jgi:hypothetical protein
MLDRDIVVSAFAFNSPQLRVGDRDAKAIFSLAFRRNASLEERGCSIGLILRYSYLSKFA